MKYLLVLFLAFVSCISFAQDSTRIKQYQSDKSQIEAELQKIQTEFQKSQTEEKQLEGAMSYNYTLLQGDTTNTMLKSNGEQLYKRYEEVKKKSLDLQTAIIKFYGYLEYNSIIIQREEEILNPKR